MIIPEGKTREPAPMLGFAGVDKRRKFSAKTQLCTLAASIRGSRVAFGGLRVARSQLIDYESLFLTLPRKIDAYVITCSPRHGGRRGITHKVIHTFAEPSDYSSKNERLVCCRSRGP